MESEAVRIVAGFDEVDDGEQHQWLVRRDAARGGAGRVQIGELAEPVLAVHREGGGRWAVTSCWLQVVGAF